MYYICIYNYNKYTNYFSFSLLNTVVWIEYTRAQLRIKGCPLPFRKAVENFNDRVNFVKDSSSACVVRSLNVVNLFPRLSAS